MTVSILLGFSSHNCSHAAASLAHCRLAYLLDIACSERSPNWTLSMSRAILLCYFYKANEGLCKTDVMKGLLCSATPSICTVFKSVLFRLLINCVCSLKGLNTPRSSELHIFPFTDRNIDPSGLFLWSELLDFGYFSCWNVCFVSKIMEVDGIKIHLKNSTVMSLSKKWQPAYWRESTEQKFFLSVSPCRGKHSGMLPLTPSFLAKLWC